MSHYNFNVNLTRVIQQLYDKATSAVIFNGAIVEWFRTTVGVRQGCLLSPNLFNVFLKKIMSDALKMHEGTVSIGGRTCNNLRFADDIDALAGKEEELSSIVERLDKTSAAYGMEINAKKTKLMTNSSDDINVDIRANGEKLETVQSFKYLGAIVTDEGSKPETLSRIAQTTSTVTKLKLIWKDRNITLRSKIRQMRSLVTSIFLYACDS
ncbi:endonuclease-reverse transcriptase [Apostichopus japonicus]|uniref:Endonuclease-reverse transcriptase n=1 Tax=Stichopus japonicus TaxID=307972 RepID=A0A2G8KI03_STIJA|nr:endonuclease-reverse transcriptase [Apostichopus japonicus]